MARARAIELSDDEVREIEGFVGRSAWRRRASNGENAGRPLFGRPGFDATVARG